MNGVPVLAVLTHAVLAVILLLVGAWGRREAADLPPGHLSDEERRHRSAVMARGSIACLVVGWGLAITVCGFLVVAVTR